jgi:hypothetical protein
MPQLRVRLINLRSARYLQGMSTQTPTREGRVLLTPADAARILEMKSAAISERELRRRCDELALEAALGWQPVPIPALEPAAKSAPTNAELRQRAAKLGVELPPTCLETVRAEARDHMLACLQFELRDGQAGHRC